VNASFNDLVAVCIFFAAASVAMVHTSISDDVITIEASVWRHSSHEMPKGCDVANPGDGKRKIISIAKGWTEN